MSLVSPQHRQELIQTADDLLHGWMQESVRHRLAREIVRAVLAALQDRPTVDSGDELMTLRTSLGDAYCEVIEMRLAVSEAREALGKIRDECGAVCESFEICTHRACMDSFKAREIAAEALELTVDSGVSADDAQAVDPVSERNL